MKGIRSRIQRRKSGVHFRSHKVPRGGLPLFVYRSVVTYLFDSGAYHYKCISGAYAYYDKSVSR